MDRQLRVKDRTPSERRRERRGTANTETASPLVRALRGAGIGILAGSLLGAAMLFICAGIVSAQGDPSALFYPVALALLGVASLVCGLIASRAANGVFLPSGSRAAAGWVLLTFLLSLCLRGGIGAVPTVYALALRIPQAALVLLGAYLGRNRPRKVERRRR